MIFLCFILFLTSFLLCDPLSLFLSLCIIQIIVSLSVFCMRRIQDVKSAQSNTAKSLLQDSTTSGKIGGEVSGANNLNHLVVSTALKRNSTEKASTSSTKEEDLEKEGEESSFCLIFEETFLESMYTDQIVQLNKSHSVNFAVPDIVPKSKKYVDGNSNGSI